MRESSKEHFVRFIRYQIYVVATSYIQVAVKGKEFVGL